MSEYVFTLKLNIDEAALRTHDGEAAPPPNDPEDWDPADLLAAQELEIVNFRDGTLERIEKVPA